MALKSAQPPPAEKLNLPEKITTPSGKELNPQLELSMLNGPAGSVRWSCGQLTEEEKNALLQFPQIAALAAGIEGKSAKPKPTPTPRPANLITALPEKILLKAEIDPEKELAALKTGLLSWGRLPSEIRNELLNVPEIKALIDKMEEKPVKRKQQTPEPQPRLLTEKFTAEIEVDPQKEHKALQDGNWMRWNLIIMEEVKAELMKYAPIYDLVGARQRK